MPPIQQGRFWIGKPTESWEDLLLDFEKLDWKGKMLFVCMLSMMWESLLNLHTSRIRARGLRHCLYHLERPNLIMNSDLLFHGLFGNRGSWYETRKEWTNHPLLTSWGRNIRWNQSILHLLRTRPRHPNSGYQILYHRAWAVEERHFSLQGNLNPNLKHFRFQY